MTSVSCKIMTVANHRTVKGGVVRAETHFSIVSISSQGGGGYPCGNFSDTPSLKLIKTKGSIGHAFTVCIHTENQNQVSLYCTLLFYMRFPFSLSSP